MRAGYRRDGRFESIPFARCGTSDARSQRAEIAEKSVTQSKPRGRDRRDRVRGATRFNPIADDAVRVTLTRVLCGPLLLSRLCVRLFSAVFAAPLSSRWQFPKDPNVSDIAISATSTDVSAKIRTNRLRIPSRYHRRGPRPRRGESGGGGNTVTSASSEHLHPAWRLSCGAAAEFRGADHA